MKLNWVEISDPNDQCHYNHTEAITPFGKFLITWKSWKDYPEYGFDETPWGETAYLGWNSLIDAKKWAQEEMIRRLQECQE